MINVLTGPRVVVEASSFPGSWYLGEKEGAASLHGGPPAPVWSPTHAALREGGMNRTYQFQGSVVQGLCNHAKLASPLGCPGYQWPREESFLCLCVAGDKAGKPGDEASHKHCSQEETQLKLKDHFHYDVMGENVGNIYMETSCFCVFMLSNYMKAYVSMYFST